MTRAIKKFFTYFMLLLFLPGCNELLDEYQGENIQPLEIDITICNILSNTENAVTGVTVAYNSLTLSAIYDTLSGDTASFISLNNSNAWRLPLSADTCFFMIYAPQVADSYFVAINSSTGFTLYSAEGQLVSTENENLSLTNVAGCPEARTRQVYASLNGAYLARVINPNVSTLHLVFLNTNIPPTADFNANPASIAIGDTVSFSDQSAQGSKPIISYKWDFGDGSASSDSSFVQHAYSDSGKFSPSITVSDGYLSNTVTKTELITVSGGGE